MAVYTAGFDVPLRLINDPTKSNPWILDDGSGQRLWFDRDHGDLTAIVDLAGHRLSIAWGQDSWKDAGGKIISVTDTTGRIIHYNYSPITFSHDGVTEAADALVCISLTVDCTHPLVSFEQSPKAGSEAYPGKIDFDLVKVRDANGDGPSYSYYSKATPTLDYIPDPQLGPFCRSLCGTKADDCHNFDACGKAVDDLVAAACVSVGMGYGDGSGRCFAYCVQECETENPHCFADSPNYASCILVEQQSWCSHPENSGNVHCQTSPCGPGHSPVVSRATMRLR